MRLARWTAALGAVVLLAALQFGAPAGAAQPHIAATPTTYYVALGDSLATGGDSSTFATSYVGLIYQHELAQIPGLQLVSFACSGATTDSMLNGSPTCGFASGSQLGDAESFLRLHQGRIAFVTLDIGINDIDQCISATSVDATCVQDGDNDLLNQLPPILSGLSAADPGVRVIGMNYYDPFLGFWLLNALDQNIATQSLSLFSQFNEDLTQIYSAAGDQMADVASVFGSQNENQGSYNNQPEPENVINICNFTLMCPLLNIHPDDAGHAAIFSAFEPLLPATGPSTAGMDMWLATADGGVFSFNSAPFFGAPNSTPLARPIVGITTTNDGGGYWLVASDGGIFAFGDAAFWGSAGGTRLRAPIVGMAATPDGNGYWLVGSDGGIFAYGDAAFFGSAGGTRLRAPIVGMAPTPDGGGYWLVASDGGIFAYGDAAFLGSAGGTRLSAPIVGMAATPDGNGYWLVASDGGIFAYGDASFFGSAGGTHLRAPIVGMAAMANGTGYWLVAADGGIFNFGNAPYLGSLASAAPGSPVVGVTTY